jgi:Protein of unknown function (DUF1565)
MTKFVILILLLMLGLIFGAGGCAGPSGLSESPTPVQTGSVIYIDPSKGRDQNPGSAKAPLKTIQRGVDLAQPSDTIILAAGDYLQDIVSKRNGLQGAPITIRGPSTAVVRGGGNSRIIEINHDYITLEGFTVDGLFGNPDESSGYRDKLIYALGKNVGSGVTGLKILDMTLRNSGGEALRLRYFAHNNEIGNCTISNCGIYDFKFSGGGNVGDGIYIGTATDQLGDGKNPTAEPDQSNNNWIHHNTIDTQGSECVDIKEGSYSNIVEYNICTGSKAPDSAGINCRGNGNILRNNEVYGNLGAGVRLGGHQLTEGINNDVYSNNIHDNQAGGIKFMSEPQGRICGNEMTNNTGGNSVGNYASLFEPTKVCQ